MAEIPRISRRAAIGRLAAGAGFVAAGPRVLGAAPRQDACAALAGQRIDWLVGWSIGGGYDVYSRLIEPVLEDALRAEVVVKNAPGASGLVAARRLSAATPDGRTLGILNGTGLVVAPSAGGLAAPVLDGDFTVLARIVDHRQSLVVGAHLGVTSLDQFVALGRRRPIVLGATGPATVNVLLGALVGDLFGIDTRLVLGFPGSVQVIASVRRGELDGMVVGDETQAGADEVLPLALFQLARPGEAGGGVPNLLDDGSLIDRQPRLFPNPEKARADLAAIEALVGVGRLIAALPGVAPPLQRCLESAILTSLRHPELTRRATRARRSLVPASAAEVFRHLALARQAMPRFDNLLATALGRAGR